MYAFCEFAFKVANSAIMTHIKKSKIYQYGYPKPAQFLANGNTMMAALKNVPNKDSGIINYASFKYFCF
jgi:hypothetical protein